jgi:cobalamin biosynthesis protein CbiG
MGVDEAMIVAGIGCRKGASAAEISAVIADALALAGLGTQALDHVAVSYKNKRDHETMQ